MTTQVTTQSGEQITVTVLESAGLHPTLVSDGKQVYQLNTWNGTFQPVN